MSWAVKLCCAVVNLQHVTIFVQVFALTFIKGYRPLVFHLPFWTGAAFGIIMQLASSPCCKGSMNITGFQIGNGTYKTLLGFNVISTVVCWGLAAIALLDNRSGRKLEGTGEEDFAVDEVQGKVHGGKSTSLLGLPVPAFLRSVRKGASSKDVGVVDRSGRGTDEGRVVSKDPCLAGAAEEEAGGADASEAGARGSGSFAVPASEQANIGSARQV
jgi:hypothetical protein